MPPRRQRTAPSAAALPASRLPLGTPHVATSPSLSHATPSITGSPLLRTQRSDLSSDRDLDSGLDKKNSHPHHSTTMASRSISTDAPAKSIAEAKLERQRKRIEEAETSLTAPAPLDRRAQGSRGKNTKWKPFDYSNDIAISRAPIDSGAPVSEVRINTFRAPSRAESITRPISALSHRTSDTYNSDLERRDSTMVDEAGFQIYKSRKQKKFAGDINAWEDKSEQRQTTVEATFDKREVYDVFGNALPGRDFIDENPGSTNGQLQFVQHPNGDVSAHQWSTDRYIWENIGQFSNIRKKVEGQLAADRLKGETAYQTLQQNTLAYFRLIAKQREAHVIGVPLSAKEIQAAIPEPAYPIAAPTGLKETGGNCNASLSALPIAEHSHENFGDLRTTSEGLLTRSTAAQPDEQDCYQAKRTAYPSITSSLTSQYRRDDPFYSNAHYTSIYGSQSHATQYIQPVVQTSRPYYATPPRASGLNYNFHFPPAAPTMYATRSTPGSYYGQSTDFTIPLKQTCSIQNSNVAQHGYSGYQTRPNYQNVNTTPVGTMAKELTNETSTPLSQHTVTFNPRTAARDQLWKLPEAAKERSQSQTNIRTVLFDPFQNQQTPATAEQEDPEKQDQTPTFSKHISGNVLQPPASFDTSPSKFFPTTLVPQLQKPPSPANSTITNELLNSSPDPPQKVSYIQTTPTIERPIASGGTKQTFKPPFFAGEVRFNPFLSSLNSDEKQVNDEKLHEWWTSGKKFARQEEFYQSLIRAQQNSASPTSTRAESSSIPPFLPPSSTSNQPQEDHTARLLIPVIENLQSYISGPPSKRRDYFCQWTRAPDWCIDSSETGNSSFYDKDWGTPPARVGRDPRYSGLGGSWSARRETPTAGRGRMGSGVYRIGGSPAGQGVAVNRSSMGGTPGIDRRFGFGGSF